MRSNAESADLLGPKGGIRLAARLARLNRRLHYHVGLFLLLFLWLFAFSGLLLNHPSWTFADYWSARHETNYTCAIIAPGPDVQGDLSQARAIMRQLGIEGEILWTTTRAENKPFEFQVRRPGRYDFITADLAHSSAAVRRADVNGWGVVKALHAFTGVQMDDARNRRDWYLTSVWAWSMDGVAAGLILMVSGSLQLWLELPKKRLPGAVALGLGTAACALFCVGLRRLF
jgi:hypothetical protein